MPAPRSTDVLAAGAVVFRPGRRVLLVHRPKYDDWSFPKGKVDPGEHPVAAAVREVDEETGLHVRLGVPLGRQHYPVGARAKRVDYWVGRVVGDDDVSRYAANDEIDDVAWVDVDEAGDVLTYERDRVTLVEARGARRRTRALVLVGPGRPQADRLVPVAAAYGVTRLVSGPGSRCHETLQAYAHTTAWDTETEAGLTDDASGPGAHPATDAHPAVDLDAVVARLLDDDRCTVLCAARPVLADLLGGLGTDSPAPGPGEVVVVHLRKRRVAATEHHALP